MEQMKAGEFYIVSHAYNAVRIDERQAEIATAYERYAPRYESDEEYDVRTMIARMMARSSESQFPLIRPCDRRQRLRPSRVLRQDESG